MASLLNAVSRVVPALLTALGVVLITAGLLTYPDPTTAGTAVLETPEIIEAPSEDGESENAVMSRVGSGMISTAPIAVKWCDTIASVSKTAANSV